jgi:hypothetical protein
VLKPLLEIAPELHARFSLEACTAQKVEKLG